MGFFVEETKTEVRPFCLSVLCNVTSHLNTLFGDSMRIDNTCLQASMEEQRSGRYTDRRFPPTLNRLPVMSECTVVTTDNRSAFIATSTQEPFDFPIPETLPPSFYFFLVIASSAFLKMGPSLWICSPFLNRFFQLTAWPNYDNRYRGM